MNIEREKQIQEDLKQQKEDLEQKLSNFPKQEETILQAPKTEDISETKSKMTFTVCGTIQQLKLLKQFILENKIEILK